MFSQVFYLLADNPDAEIFATLERSRSLMRGNKWRLFRLWILFFGLILASVVTLFIGLFWIVPWARVSQTIFYESLMSEERTAA